MIVLRVTFISLRTSPTERDGTADAIHPPGASTPECAIDLLEVLNKRLHAQA
ncbi:hypothetical protein [[Pseudopropionibacterium] massiliense]|uniref:hypothetical protein n=1 Tax=[Pseudopropionibacterium] massiliense TaxID=2220000 RepID=UPI0013EF419B|nr:hypothetical protein [[Pseudopropionibacterium] massiliense]